MLSVLLNCYLYLSSVCLPCKFYALLRVIDRFESRRVFKLHLPFLFKLMSFMGHTQTVQVKRERSSIDFRPLLLFLFSCMRQSISWTLDNNVEHTTLLYIIYSSHIHIYISNLHISFLYLHNCWCYMLCFLLFLYNVYFVYLYIIILFSVSCPFAVFRLHCGASVTITHSSYVQTYLANKAHSLSHCLFYTLNMCFFRLFLFLY